MAVQDFTAAPSLTTDAQFRDWGKKMSDAMTAVGFLKTADSGQIDWATVTKPASANTSAGYEIRAFSDGVQATNPVVVRIDYGSGAGASSPGFTVCVGRSSDGSGELSGERTFYLSVRGSNSSSTAYNCYVSGDSDRIAVCMFANSAYQLLFYIERTKSSVGAATSLGVNIVWAAQGKNYQVFFPRKGLGYVMGVADNSICCLSHASGNTAIYNGNTGLFPIMPFLGYPENPDLGGCVYFPTDIAFNTDVSLTILGSSHTYKTLGGSIGSVNGAGSRSLAMRYE